MLSRTLAGSRGTNGELPLHCNKSSLGDSWEVKNPQPLLSRRLDYCCMGSRSSNAYNELPRHLG